MSRLARCLPVAVALLLVAFAPVDDANAKLLRTWLRDVQRGRIDLDADAFNGLRRLLDDALASTTRGPSSTSGESAGPPDPVDDALLDLAALGLAKGSRRGADRDAPPDPMFLKVREISRRRLVQRADDPANVEVFAWLARSILANPKESVGRRVAALATLCTGRPGRALEPLLATATLEKPPQLQRAALDEMIGWPHRSITEFLLERTSLGGEGGVVETASVARHLAEIESEIDPDDQDRVFTWVAPHLRADDWRVTARALSLLRPLQTERAYPILIEALEDWVGRRDLPTASSRIENDITEELVRRSGRAIGPYPERWRNWWKLVQAGTVPPPPKPGDDEERTQATFFSLRPSSKRVTFVIDRSGSMSAKFGEDRSRSRYEKAVEQVLAYLTVSGENTRFNVILFSDGTLRWKTRLQPATERNRETLERWLLYNGPEGGTHLREAVESALELKRDGSADLGRLESDTVVVLCDGDTYKGSGWVAATLERVNDRAQVVFQCVQIGREGDGTLELLARETGGDFIRILR